jgi:hypothetical protein
MEMVKWVKQFRQDLTDGTRLSGAKGLDIFFSEENRELGQVSDEMLVEARNSAIFVAIVTGDSFAGNNLRFLQREMEAFRESGPLEGRFCAITLDPDMGTNIAKAMPAGNPDAFWHELEFFFKDGGTFIRLAPGVEDEKDIIDGTSRKRLPISAIVSMS